MGKMAFMFPGQGAQYVGMGKDFYDTMPVCREIFDKASELAGFDMKRICFEENEEIHVTEYTQAAMLTVSAAILAAMKEQAFPWSDVNAGLSLGEYGALLASDVMSFEDACRVVRKRGIYMQEAVPQGLGGMSAVLGLDYNVIEGILEQVTDGIVQIANYNCPGQIVISGEIAAVEKAGELLKEAGAKRVVPLKVSGPFHSAMLAPAGEKLAKELEQVEIRPVAIPYIANVTAKEVTDAGEVKELLKQQVSSSVRWQQSVELMIAMGVDTFVEIGPGKTLSGFMKKIDRSKKVMNIATVEDFEKVKAELLS
jgi:[acyl-carrier-protein] S-malonyltransferase